MNSCLSGKLPSTLHGKCSNHFVNSPIFIYLIWFVILITEKHQCNILHHLNYTYLSYFHVAVTKQPTRTNWERTIYFGSRIRKTQSIIAGEAWKSGSFCTHRIVWQWLLTLWWNRQSEQDRTRGTVTIKIYP